MKKLISILVVCLLAGSSGAAIISDHFNDGVLGSQWNVSFENVVGWNYTEADSKLIVTDITMDPAITGTVHGIVTLSQAVDNLSDFIIDFGISWDAGGLDSRMEVVGVFAMSGNSSNNGIFNQAYYDPWVKASAGKMAGFPNGVFFSSGPDTLPYSGQAVFKLTRTAGLVRFYWDGNLILSGTNNTLIEEIAIQFRKVSYSTGTFGTLSVDYINVVPEPATLLLLGLGALGLLRRGK